MKFYEILGLNKNSSSDEIKKAYRKMAMTHHPDKGGKPETFKEIIRAYSTLSDPAKKAQYDAVGDAHYDENNVGDNNIDPTNIFEHLWGKATGNGFFQYGSGGAGGRNSREEQRKCRNIQHVIKITNKEAYFGGNKFLKAIVRKRCMDCVTTCMFCQGKGQINELQRMGPFTTMSVRQCDKCNGSGEQMKGKKTCSTCLGKCDYSEEHKLELQIPEGVDTGYAVTFKGLGEQPTNKHFVAGDLIFEILVIADTIFERVGLNIIYKSELTFLESIVGKEIEVPLYDEQYKVSTGTFGIIEPNKQYKVSGKGMKRSSEDKKGDLIIVFQIKYPSKELTSEFKESISAIFEKHSVSV